VPSPSRPSPSTLKRQRRARRAQAPEVLDALEADVRAARELLDDLSALVDAGLVAPVRTRDAIRYAVIDNIEHLPHT
jgi:hypothetical protein